MFCTYCAKVLCLDRHFLTNCTPRPHMLGRVVFLFGGPKSSRPKSRGSASLWPRILSQMFCSGKVLFLKNRHLLHFLLRSGTSRDLISSLLLLSKGSSHSWLAVDFRFRQHTFTTSVMWSLDFLLGPYFILEFCANAQTLDTEELFRYSEICSFVELAACDPTSSPRLVYQIPVSLIFAPVATTSRLQPASSVQNLAVDEKSDS